MMNCLPLFLFELIELFVVVVVVRHHYLDLLVGTCRGKLGTSAGYH